MYAVIGGNGFLGNYIIRNILEHTTEYVLATARNVRGGVYSHERLTWCACDIQNENQFEALVSRLKSYDNVKVVFLAAYHHPDLVNENPQYAWNINVTTLSSCVNQLYFVDRFFYASTDSVYGNSIDGYHFKEKDALNPVNIYGRQKAAAEAVVQYAGFNVVRYPFLIAPSLVPGKKHFYDHLVSDLMNGKRIEMFADSYRSSLHFDTAARLLVQLCELPGEIPSVVNICGDDDLSKYDIGLMIAEKSGVSSELVCPITMLENADIFKSPRAQSTLMDNSLIKKLLQLEAIKLSI